MNNLNDYRQADLDLFYKNAIEMLSKNDGKYDYMVIDKLFSLVLVAGEEIVGIFIKELKEAGLPETRINAFIEKISMNYSVLAGIAEDKTDIPKNIYHKIYSIIETA